MNARGLQLDPLPRAPLRVGRRHKGAFDSPSFSADSQDERPDRLQFGQCGLALRQLRRPDGDGLKRQRTLLEPFLDLAGETLCRLPLLTAQLLEGVCLFEFLAKPDDALLSRRQALGITLNRHPFALVFTIAAIHAAAPVGLFQFGKLALGGGEGGIRPAQRIDLGLCRIEHDTGIVADGVQVLQFAPGGLGQA